MTSALLVIDFQNGLVSTTPLPGDVAEVTANINALTSRARGANVPVVFVLHEDDEELLHGSPAWELSRALHVEPGDHRIHKRAPDSFLDTELQPLLVVRGVKHVVVCGYASEFCVDTTVRRAAANGYTVTIASDAHTTHDKSHSDAARIREHHNATLSNIGSFGPKIAAIPTDAINFKVPL
ncbi:isochorismatase [Pandoraea terrae]|uniref:Isochorismatase n=1 Tax=Pandoraea terrae TaxID=1537710 RepID=A0A5E4VHS1_9BURK|nr:isochorismatase family protein [Pandoraea terrae]VVE10575.1 isochorismatase [Pandoraea terrae]